MREKAAAKKHPAARVRRVPWFVIEVQVLPAHRLFVRFADGTHGEVDAAPMILGPNPGVFKQLRDPGAFARAFIDDGAVTWPGGLDLAPDTMYDKIKARGRYVMQA